MLNDFHPIAKKIPLRGLLISVLWAAFDQVVYVINTWLIADNSRIFFHAFLSHSRMMAQSSVYRSVNHYYVTIVSSSKKFKILMHVLRHVYHAWYGNDQRKHRVYLTGFWVIISTFIYDLITKYFDETCLNITTQQLLQDRFLAKSGTLPQI